MLSVKTLIIPENMLTSKRQFLDVIKILDVFRGLIINRKTFSVPLSDMIKTYKKLLLFDF